MDLIDDIYLINGDFNLINEISDDYEKALITKDGRREESIEILFSVAISSISENINKSNRVDFQNAIRKQTNPWVFKKDRVEHLQKIADDKLAEEIEIQEAYLLRELEYENYICNVEYPDTSSLDPRDEIKCYYLNDTIDHCGWSTIPNFIIENDVMISNVYFEFELIQPYLTIDTNDFLKYLFGFQFNLCQYGKKLFDKGKRDFQYPLYNFLPDVISGMIDGFDFNPDVGKFVVKIANKKLFKNRYIIDCQWRNKQEIFDLFNVKIYVYGRHCDEKLFKKLDPKDITNYESDSKTNFELFSNKHWVTDYFSQNKITLADVFYNYTQVIGIVIRKKSNQDNYIQSIDINSISFDANGMSGLNYNREDIVVLEFLDVKIYLVMFDPMLKDLNTFKQYLQGTVDYEHVSGIELNRIDTFNCKIKLNTVKPIDFMIFNIGIGHDKVY